ncbi:hypothetical protein HPP92_016587 [Vanilla planifolia]|uniref:Uncharacterized protein n=1 Tax=Vanilla planifolia TaxID=51239 RepID=A0A835QF18_VANPL|nr:hypothetical protein HPP92_017180 [Vanilla planifolia]KAG0472041.1 hypothetical protein HPP92_016587 [Vanilla planifolia]
MLSYYASASPRSFPLYTCCSTRSSFSLPSLVPVPGVSRYRMHTSLSSSRSRPMAQPFRHFPACAALGSNAGVSSGTVSEPSSSSVVGQHDLLIVGPGVLGRLVAEQWQKDYPGCNVFGQTMTTDHHEELTKLGIKPSLRGTSDIQCPNIMFCAPPSRTADYPNDVRLATTHWNGEGSFLFTSSSAVYECDNGGLFDEDSPVPIGTSSRANVLLKAEKAALEANANRGAHVYYLKKGVVDLHPDHILNLIHYEDAATLAIAIMKKNLRGRVFLGCDNNPLSRHELMECVNQSGKFKKKFQGFTGPEEPIGKKLNNSKTRAEIGWQPKYPTFAHFLSLLA